MTLREALLSMGYREEQPNKWLKPVGYVLFSYNETTNQWANWFKSSKGDIEYWETNQFVHDENKAGSYLYQLKKFECWTRTDLYTQVDSEFHLRAIDL